MSDAALPYNGTTGYDVGSDTSEAAARAVADETAGRMQEQILDLLRDAGPFGMTSMAVEAALGGARQSSVSANLRSLEVERHPERGRVVTIATRVRNETGRDAHPYVLTSIAEGVVPHLIREPTPPRTMPRRWTPESVLDWIAMSSDAAALRGALRSVDFGVDEFAAVRERIKSM